MLILRNKPSKNKTIVTADFTDKSGQDYEMEVKTKRVICDRCDGLGTHDHPAFSNGVDGLDDLDFAEEYFNGAYDVRCEECHGEKIILDVDEDALSKEELEDYYRAQDNAQWSEAERRAELRMGC